MILPSLFGFAFFALTLVVFFAPESLRPFDTHIERFFAQFHTPAWSKVFASIAFLGSAYGIVLVSLVAVAASDFNQELIELGLVAVAGSSATAQIVKIIVARVRPERLAWRKLEPEYSYPSGHSTAALASYGVLAWYAYAPLPSGYFFLSALCIIVILLVGASRLALSVHHASDVIGGYLLAISWLFFALALFA